MEGKVVLENAQLADPVANSSHNKKMQNFKDKWQIDINSVLEVLTVNIMPTRIPDIHLS